MNIVVDIRDQPLSVSEVYNSVLADDCGGIALFVGTVRNHNKGKAVRQLEFEAYKPMAIKEMQKIAEHCCSRLGAEHITIVHRAGLVGITDIAVIIAVSSVHRAAAFDACQYAIDTLKETVPIWKKEYLTDGSYWVGARP